MKVGSLLAGAAALALLAGAARAQSIKDFPEVADTSFVQVNGEKVLQIALTIPAPRKAVWDRFTTTEGYKAWAVPVAKIEPGLGGVIEGSYDIKAKIGDANNIRNQIVVYAPERTLAIKNIQAPKELPGGKEFGEIVTVMQFEDVGAEATRLTLTAIGYKPGEPYDTLYRHFGWGNAYSLMKLKESFVKGPIDWQAVAAQQQAQAASAKVTER
ncbi:MAG: SRPBCC domain-containing protein [Phenylobacterium sp.]